MGIHPENYLLNPFLLLLTNTPWGSQQEVRPNEDTPGFRDFVSVLNLSSFPSLCPGSSLSNASRGWEARINLLGNVCPTRCRQMSTWGDGGTNALMHLGGCKCMFRAWAVLQERICYISARHPPQSDKCPSLPTPTSVLWGNQSAFIKL